MDTRATNTSRLIGLATALLGSRDAVREKMRASEEDFDRWACGVAEVPWPEFSRLIDLIIDEQAARIKEHQRLIENSRR